MPKFQGVIFDVDGVLVDSPHQKAWRDSLREMMESSWSDIRDRTTWSPDGFTSQVYQQYVSGKPRASGARGSSRTSSSRWLPASARRAPARPW